MGASLKALRRKSKPLRNLLREPIRFAFGLDMIAERDSLSVRPLQAERVVNTQIVGTARSASDSDRYVMHVSAGDRVSIRAHNETSLDENGLVRHDNSR